MYFKRLRGGNGFGVPFLNGALLFIPKFWKSQTFIYIFIGSFFISASFNLESVRNFHRSNIFFLIRIVSLHVAVFKFISSSVPPDFRTPPFSQLQEYNSGLDFIETLFT